MAGRRAAILTGIAACGAAVLAAAAVGAPTPPPGFNAAVAACSAQGLQQGSQAFAQCVAKQLGGSAPPPEAAAKLKAAQDVCAAGGLKQGSQAFAQCVQQQLSAGKPPGASGPSPTSPAVGSGHTSSATSLAQKAAQQCLAQGVKPKSPDLNACVQRMLLKPAQQAAYDACIAQGKSAGNGLADCVNATLQAGAAPRLTARQQDDVDYCLGLHKVQGTPEFIACIRTAGNRNLTPAQQAAVDQCQKQGLKENALATCVGGLLTVKLPPSPGSTGPSPAAVQAAFQACIKRDLKPKTAAFQACVTAKLGP